MIIVLEFHKGEEIVPIILPLIDKKVEELFKLFVIYPIFVKSISSAYPVAPVLVPLLSHSHLCPFM